MNETLTSLQIMTNPSTMMMKSYNRDTPQLYKTNHSSHPTLLIESLYLTSPPELQMYMSSLPTLLMVILNQTSLLYIFLTLQNWIKINLGGAQECAGRGSIAWMLKICEEII